jgi:quercetin dioxygenase-like cupin family protein
MTLKTPLVLKPQEGESVWWKDSSIITFKVGKNDTEGRYSLTEGTVQPGGGAEPHMHPNEDEIFYIIRGQLKLTIGDKTLTALPGAFAKIPRTIGHAFVNEGSEDAVFLNPFIPAGLEQMFREGGRLRKFLGSAFSEPSPTDIEKVAAAALKYNVVMNPDRSAWRSSPWTIILEKDEGPKYRLPFSSEIYSIKLPCSHTNGDCSVVEILLPQAEETPLFCHYREHKGFYVAAGEVEFIIGSEQRFPAPIGTFVLIPKGMSHALKNISDSDARVLLFSSPGGIERFYQNVGQSLMESSISLDTSSTLNLEEIQEQYEILIIQK